MLVAVMMGAASIVFAQENKDVKRIDPATKMKQELSLSDAQYQSIQEIERKYKTERETLRNDKKDADQKRRVEAKSLAESREREIKAVLTPEQQAQWEAKKEERRKEHASKRGEGKKFDKKAHHGKHTRGKHMHAKAHEPWKSIEGLTEDQTKQLREASKAKVEKFKASREKSEKLSDEQIKKINDDYNTAVKKILTKDQFKKWEELKKEHATNRENGKGSDSKKGNSKHKKEKK
jgi:Spy/CpxP family protein refolding chaperone